LYLSIAPLLPYNNSTPTSSTWNILMQWSTQLLYVHKVDILYIYNYIHFSHNSSLHINFIVTHEWPMVPWISFVDKLKVAWIDLIWWMLPNFTNGHFWSIVESFWFIMERWRDSLCNFPILRIFVGDVWGLSIWSIRGIFIHEFSSKYIQIHKEWI